MSRVVVKLSVAGMVALATTLVGCGSSGSSANNGGWSNATADQRTAALPSAGSDATCDVAVALHPVSTALLPVATRADLTTSLQQSLQAVFGNTVTVSQVTAEPVSFALTFTQAPLGTTGQVISGTVTGEANLVSRTITFSFTSLQVGDKVVSGTMWFTVDAQSGKVNVSANLQTQWSPTAEAMQIVTTDLAIMTGANSTFIADGTLTITPSGGTATIITLNEVQVSRNSPYPLTGSATFISGARSFEVRFDGTATIQVYVGGSLSFSYQLPTSA